ncbi:aspartate kinase [Anoxynatronum buryatiense]|uniref:Aspartokinase n=1 Tax=Anoxynatronum buryatiense TaxID=489973 RepID=A0AA46AHK0_9CLOT|nr:aspartate kinase [Anoxynatronum buryatiense]SMP40419.1 aspartate kinase [Anoxynatronum buryatiense]
MSIIVQKYGGTSVSTPERIKAVANRVIQKKNQGHQLVVIVSAMGKTTDSLIELARQVTDSPAPREMDMLLTTGEQVSISLLAMALMDQGQPAISFTGPQLGIQTTALHQKARILDIDVSRIHQALAQNQVVVVAGFQGVAENKEITTLGRGGSDTSAVALAAKLRAACEIYTDVEGIYTMDPRKLPGAKKLNYITSEEMMEMASLGAGVLHHRSVELAHKFKVPLYLASTFSDQPGTWVVNGGNEGMEESLVTGMTSSRSDVQVTLMNLPAGMKSLRRIFSEMAEKEVNVDMISQMMNGNQRMYVSFTIPREDVQVARSLMESWHAEDDAIHWDINEKIVKMSIVGLGMRTHSGVAGRVFAALEGAGIELKMVTTSEINISWVLAEEDEAKAIQAIGQAFELAEEE